MSWVKAGKAAWLGVRPGWLNTGAEQQQLCWAQGPRGLEKLAQGWESLSHGSEGDARTSLGSDG